MSTGDTIAFQGEELPTFADKGFMSILPTFCSALDAYTLEPIDTVEGISIKPLSEGIDKPFMKGFFKPFGMDKVEKICVANCILMDRILVSALIVIPGDDYDLPMLVLEWSETEDVISVLVDFVPLADPIMAEGYREKYLDVLDQDWAKYSELPWMKPNRFAWCRMLMSPYYLSGAAPKESEQNKKDCLEIISKYLQSWITLWQEAAPIQDEQEKGAIKKRKDRLRAIFRANDEGAKTMEQMLGKEIIEMLLLCNF